VTDITYIRTDEHWLYLCIVLDLFNDLVVGWSIDAQQESEMVMRAVLMAVRQREGAGPTILHSDRGSQFTSGDYQDILKENGEYRKNKYPFHHSSTDHPRVRKGPAP
jgi:putative transposase